MKKIFTGVYGLTLLFSLQINAQQSDVDLFVTDMLKVADDYASPAAEGASYLSGGGWFSSAQSLGLWKVDLSLHANALFIPEKRRNSSISDRDYRILKVRGAESATIPTAFGGETDVYFEGSLNIFGNPVNFDFQAIEGVNKKVVGNPFLQGAVGLPMNTELILRFSPQLTINDVSYSTYGAGLKHNISQYFLDSEPTDFQFAAFVSYSKFDVDYAFTSVDVPAVVKMNRIEVDADLWLLQLLSSKTLSNSNWEVLGALGFTNSNFGYVLGGSGIALEEINNELETLNNNEIEIKGDLGLNYRIDKFMISSMLSLGKFYNLNVGLHYRL